jgi:hypothetical protein
MPLFLSIPLLVFSKDSDFKTANSLLYKELAKNGKNVVSVTPYGIKSYGLKSEFLTMRRVSYLFPEKACPRISG